MSNKIFRNNKSFTVRLTVTILIFTFLVFVSTFLIVGSIVNSSLREEAGYRTSSALETATLYINSNLREVETAVENNSWLVEGLIDDTSQMHNITSKLICDCPGIIGSIIALNPEKCGGKKFAGYSKLSNDNMNIISKNISSNNYDYLMMDWYQIPCLLKKPSWSEPYYDDGGADKIVTTYSYPLMDSLGEVYAIFTADLSLQWLTAKATSIKPYEESCTYILSKNGSFVVNELDLSSAETVFSYAFKYDQDSVLLKAAKRIQAGISYYFVGEFNGEETYGVYGPLDNGWSIVMTSSFFDILQPNLVVNLALFVIAIISLIVLSLISVRLIKNLTKPVREFSDVILKIADDKLDNKLPEVNTEDELKVLHDAIYSLQNSIKENREHRKDIQSARDIQLSIVPNSHIGNSWFDLYAIVDPAKEVGGDLYDYHFSEKKNRLFFLVGDVSGKGFPASLFMSMVVSAFRMISRLGMDEYQIVKHINSTISLNNDTDMFVTMFFACIDYETYTMKLCNAGHNPPLLINPDGSAQYLKVKPNIPIGALDDFDFQSDQIQLQKGSRLLIYSDGVTEAECSDKSQYGEERLLKWALSLPKDYTSEQAVKSLRSDVSDFTNSLEENNPQNDDITIMIITI